MRLVQLAVFLASQAVRVAPFASPTPSFGTRRLSVFVSAAAAADDVPERRDGGKNHGRGISSSELRKMNEMRRQQRLLAEDEEEDSKFVVGDDLHLLRRHVLGLRQELEEARLLQATDRIKQLERAILQVLQVDAEFVYDMALERMKDAQLHGDMLESEKYRKEAECARKALPQFNLDGLWVGKYGDHGFEMINVTYVGDTLIAYKVTGDQNVPKGEISFTVNLGKEADADFEDLDGEDVLEPIELADDAAEQWGSRYLTRFGGKGQVAASGFIDSQWMEGQLILVGKEYFSFAWLPIAHQVFFGRPSAELTLKLLREARTEGLSEADQNRQHLSRCMEETEHINDEMEINGGLFKSHNQLDYYSQPGCFD